MPWAETDPMAERLRFVMTLRKRKTSFRSLCTTFGVAPKTGYKWLRQFDALGPAGLQDRSRRPKSNSQAISAAVGERLIELRQEHPTWGPKKLVAWLETHERDSDVPAPSTVGELLKRRGLVTPRTRSRSQRRASEPLRHADKPNAVWSMDFKGWFRLGDGTRCDPLTMTDAHSRYLLFCKAGTRGFTSPCSWRPHGRHRAQCGHSSGGSTRFSASTTSSDLTRRCSSVLQLPSTSPRHDPFRTASSSRSTPAGTKCSRPGAGAM